MQMRKSLPNCLQRFHESLYLTLSISLVSPKELLWLYGNPLSGPVPEVLGTLRNLSKFWQSNTMPEILRASTHQIANMLPVTDQLYSISVTRC
jgi:hypothetical protein